MWGMCSPCLLYTLSASTSIQPSPTLARYSIYNKATCMTMQASVSITQILLLKVSQKSQVQASRMPCLPQLDETSFATVASFAIAQVFLL